MHTIIVSSSPSVIAYIARCLSTVDVEFLHEGTMVIGRLRCNPARIVSMIPIYETPTADIVHGNHVIGDLPVSLARLAQVVSILTPCADTLPGLYRERAELQDYRVYHARID